MTSSQGQKVRFYLNEPQLCPALYILICKILLSPWHKYHLVLTLHTSHRGLVQGQMPVCTCRAGLNSSHLPMQHTGEQGLGSLRGMPELGTVMCQMPYRAGPL